MFKYFDPRITLGKGKNGPVDLIIVNNKFYALKRISKISIDNSKRIQHILTEKKILQVLKENQNDMEFLVRLHKTFTDEENVCFVFEYLEGPDLSTVLL